jgi:hypothetical protein
MTEPEDSCDQAPGCRQPHFMGPEQAIISLAPLVGRGTG